MAITLTTAELAGLTRAAQLLASPLAFTSVDDWRSSVNRELKALLGADSAGFLLPVPDGPLLYSDEHDQAQLARYSDLHPPPLADGTTIWERLIAARVSTMPTAYDGDVRLYLESAYYNEYAAPNGARDTLCAMLPLAASEPADPTRLVSVQLWRDDGVRRLFGERERFLLQLLVPSLSSGADLILRWRRERERLLRTLDSLGASVQVFDLTGRLVHQTPATARELLDEPEAALVRAALQRTAMALAGTVRWARAGADVLVNPHATGLTTTSARYAIRATVYESAGEREALLLVTLDRLTPRPPSAEVLRAKFALTPSEARVALLLARGTSNREIADALGVRPCTARRHTERVLQKLGVSSRAAVGPRIA